MNYKAYSNTPTTLKFLYYSNLLFNMSTIQVKNISLFIPRVFLNISKEFISDTFYKMGFGQVSRVDLVYQNKPKPYNSAYIHFESWRVNKLSENLQQRIFKEGKAKVVYDDPWFWIVLENTSREEMKPLEKLPERFIQGYYRSEELLTLAEAEQIIKENNETIHDFDVFVDIFVSRKQMSRINDLRIENLHYEAEISKYIDQIWDAEVEEIYDQMDELERLMEDEEFDAEAEEIYEQMDHAERLMEDEEFDAEAEEIYEQMDHAERLMEDEEFDAEAEEIYEQMDHAERLMEENERHFVC